MKKFLSITLCICFVFGMSLSVSAVTTENTADMMNEFTVSAEAEIIASKDMKSGIVSYSTFEYEQSASTNTRGITGEVSEGWFPTGSDSETNDASTYSLIGKDNRTKVKDTEEFPYSAICYIEIDWPDGSTGLGTAWMIYSDIAITAGHCVYST